MIGPVFFDTQDALLAVERQTDDPYIGRILEALKVAIPCKPVKRRKRTKYGWERLLSSPSPVVFPQAKGVTLNDMAKRMHHWANWNGAKVATRQVNGELHAWLVRPPRGK